MTSLDAETAPSPAAAPEGRVLPLRRVHLFLTLATVGLAPLVVLVGLTDPVMLPKATVVQVGALLVLLLAAVRLLLAGRLVVPRSLPLAVLAALVLAMAVATVASEHPATSALGRFSRYGGLASYAAYAVLCAAVAVLAGGRALRALTATILTSAAAFLTYGFLQVAGLDPIGWVATRGDVAWFSTMGNTNFASAFAGMLLPLALSVALSREVQVRWRAASAAVAAAAAVYTLLLGALQGPLVGVVGSAFVLGVALADRRRASREGPDRPRRGRPHAAVLAATALVLLAPVAWFVQFVLADLPKSSHQRLQLWQAALSMWRESPLIGLGLDTYGYYFLPLRPAAHAAERGVAFADTPHSVPLGMLASGGLLVFAAYATFVLAVGVVLVRGVRRSRGAQRMAIAGFGGMWLGYHVQSLVSVDVPAVTLLHFVSAGGVLAATHAVRLPPVRPPRGWHAPRVAVAALLAVLAVPLSGVAMQPLAADIAAGQAALASARGERDEALQASARAVRLNPWEPSYRRVLGKRLYGRDPKAAVPHIVRAAEQESGSVRYAKDVTRVAAEQGDAALAARWHAELARRDAQGVGTLLEAARWFAAHGRQDEARSLYERVLALRPGQRDAVRWLARDER